MVRLFAYEVAFTHAWHFLCDRNGGSQQRSDIIEMKRQNKTEVEISTAVYDEITWGFGSYASEKYWDYANSVAKSAMERSFPYLKNIDDISSENGRGQTVYNIDALLNSKRTLQAKDSPWY